MNAIRAVRGKLCPHINTATVDGVGGLVRLQACIVGSISNGQQLIIFLAPSGFINNCSGVPLLAEPL